MFLPCALQQPWVQDLIASYKDSKLVFSADGNSAEARQHLSTGLSQDHLVGDNGQAASGSLWGQHSMVPMVQHNLQGHTSTQPKGSSTPRTNVVRTLAGVLTGRHDVPKYVAGKLSRMCLLTVVYVLLLLLCAVFVAVAEQHDPGHGGAVRC